MEISCCLFLSSCSGSYPYRLYSHISPSLPSGATAAGMSYCFDLSSSDAFMIDVLLDDVGCCVCAY